MDVKCIFCSSVYKMDDYAHLSSKSKIALSLADHNLNRNIIRGLDEAWDTPITLINNVQIPNYPKYPRIFFKKQPWQHTPGAQDINCGFINLPVLKHISRGITTFCALKKQIKAAKNEKICLLTYDIRLGAAIAIRLIKKLYPQVLTGIVMPDIPTAVLAASSGGKVTWKTKLWAKQKMRFIRQFDSYIFVTEDMKDIVDVSQKPYTVVEGIYNDQQPPLAEPTTEEKIIFYSGQLNPAYGMENLLEAFTSLYPTHPDYRLWICGSGRLSQRITELAEQCPGIRYFGYVDGNRVRQLQSEATALINPRQNTGGLTKYSFPSKTMEYLASGRPVIGYKLDGIPEEYDPYMQYVEDNSVEALKAKLVQVCSLPAEERRQLGENARAFILKYKTPKMQCEKIKKMICAALGDGNGA